MKTNSFDEKNYCPNAPTCGKGVWELDIKEKKITPSPRWKKMFPSCQSGSDYFNQWLEKLDSSSAQKIRSGLNDLVTGKNSNFVVHYSLFENGEEKYYRHYTEVAEKDEQGKPTVLVGVEEDITTRHLIEEKFRETNHRFSMLIQSINGGVLVENSMNEIIFVNKKFCELFEIKNEPELLIGANFIQELEQSRYLFKKPDIFFQGIEDTILLGVPESGYKIELTNRQVLERDFIPLMLDNQLKGNLWFFKDITKFAQVEKSLTLRLRFEELLTNLSSNFIRLNKQDVDKEVDIALAQIGRYIDADRSYVFMFSDNMHLMSNTHEWCNEGITPEKSNLQNIPTDVFPWWMSKLLRFESVIIPSVPDLPPKAASEKSILEKQGIKSLVVVPMIYGNKLLGYLGFDSVRRYRKWDDGGIKLLKMASSMLMNAIKRKDNEEALSQSEEKYKSVVNSINEIIFQTDAVGIWTFLNSAWSVITGFSMEESLGKNFLDFVHPEDRERNVELFKPLIERKKDHCNHEIRYLTKSGGFKWIDVYAVLTINENDEIIGTSGVLRDITARRESASEIKKLTQAVETNPTAVMLTNPAGSIEYVNQSLQKMIGFNREEIIGKNTLDFLDQNSKSILVEEVRPILRKGEEWRGEIKIKRKDKSLFPAEIVTSSVRDDQGNAEYYLVNFNDITERKKAEEDIQKSLIKERELNALKTKFLSFVSHEFRTPLTAILSSAEMLELYADQLDETKKQTHYSNIKKSIDNLIALLNDVSDINRADSGKIKVNPEEFELVTFLQDLVTELLPGYPDHPEIIWNLEIKELEVSLDLKLFRQLSSNMISNAIKYTPKEKKVYISLTENEDKFVLMVEDQGIGISDDDQKTIFEPFIRGRNVNTIKGTGLGLAILKRAANLLQGEISLTSKINVGTTLRAKLPQKIDSMFRTRM